MDENNVYVVWQDVSSPGEILFKRSTDGGITFEPTQLVSGTFSGFQPSIAVSGTNIYIAWSRQGEIIFTRSTDGGLTFESPLSIFQYPDGVESVQLTAGDNSVYLTWLGVDAQTLNTEVFFIRSTDAGITFSTAKNLSMSPAGSSDDARITTNANGKDIYVVWVESDPISGLINILIVTSHNSGQNFRLPKILPTGNASVDMSRVATNENGKTVSVAWRDVGENPGITDEIKFTQSFNSGTIFGPIINISNSPTVGSAYSELSINSTGVTSIVWLEGSLPTGGQQPEDVFLRQVFGSFLSSPLNVSQTLERSFSPTVSIDDTGNSHIAWEEHTDTFNPEIFFSKIAPRL